MQACATTLLGLRSWGGRDGCRLRRGVGGLVGAEGVGRLRPLGGGFGHVARRGEADDLPADAPEAPPRGAAA